jgi:Polyketide cyclase / dehydrase and lipid transport
MWSYEHAALTRTGADRLWSVWSDVANWSAWNPDLTDARLDGPFRTGSMIAMTLESGDVIELTLVEVIPGTRFVDEATLDGVTVRTEHRIEAADAGSTRVVYATQVTGAVPDQVLADIGAGVTGDFPQTVAALLDRAESVAPR